MPVNVLFADAPERWTLYRPHLPRALADAGVEAEIGTDFPPDQVDYIIYAPSSAVQDFTPHTRLKALLALWAGAEDADGNQTLTVPLARMVDHGLTRGMVEWVTGHVLRHHLGMDAHIHGQDGRWRTDFPPLAEDRPVSILGLGTLGLACGEALGGLGFPVTGWSRSAKSHPVIRCMSGPDGLKQALASAAILVLLLPDTPATENTLDAETLALLPSGSFILNPGRGALIDDDALLAALNSGRIAHATLDASRTEPLPPDHPYWQHPAVTVTPHIASTTREKTASEVIAENVRRGEAGEPFLHLVDRDRGY